MDKVATQRGVHRNVLRAMAPILLGISGIFASHGVLADYSLPNGQPLFDHGNYDYAPSIIEEGTLRKFWWCGLGQVPGTSFQTDVIYYRTFNVITSTWSSITQVLAPTPSRWDSYYVCDPSVIRGVFANPENGVTYSYAMYYTATDLQQGTNNRIGLAYSNDGVTWIKLSHPVIYPDSYPTTTYGAGQAATYSSNGLAAIRIFYTDSSVGRTITRRATDGINFDPPVAVSTATDTSFALGSGNDFAYDTGTGYFYAVTSMRPVRTGQREGYQLGLLRMRAVDLFAGQGTWQSLGYVSTDSTGFDLNHNPALLRDKYGNLTHWLPNVTMYFGAGTGDPVTWNLASATWRASPSRVPLRRYYSPTCASAPPDHWVTTGYVRPSCGYQFELVLGYLPIAPTAGTQPLYGCAAGSDHFLSRNSTCEGHKMLGITGWIYASQAAGTVALYRCRTAALDHFATFQSNCEGQVYEQVLGYLPQSP